MGALEMMGMPLLLTMVLIFLILLIPVIDCTRPAAIRWAFFVGLACVGLYLTVAFELMALAWLFPAVLLVGFIILIRRVHGLA